MQETVVIHDTSEIKKVGHEFSLFGISILSITLTEFKHCYFIVNHHDGSSEKIEYDQYILGPNSATREAAYLRRSNEFQKLLHRFQKDNYKVDAKYVSLFVDSKIDKIILQKTQK